MKNFRFLPLPRNSLGKKLMSVWGVALLATLIIFSLSVLYFVNRTESDSWRGRQKEAAHSAANTVSDFIRRVSDVLAIISIVDADDVRNSSDELRAFLEQNPAFLEIVRTDDKGAIIASTYRENSVLANLITIPQSQWFLQARAGQNYIGNLQLSARNEPYLIMAVPCADGGVVAARVRMNVLWDVVHTIHFGTNGQAYVIARNGHVIAHTNPEVVLKNTSLQDLPEYSEILAAANNEWDGAFINFEGERVVAITESIAGTDWLIVTELPLMEAFQSTRIAIAVLGVMAFLLMGVVSGLVSQFVRRVIANPMIELREGAETIGKGDLAHRIRSKSNDEIGELSTAFNTMAEKLQERDALLEEQRAEIRASESRYRAIVEDQTELICRFKAGGILVFVNEAYCHYFNKGREELIGQSFMPLIPEEDRLEVEKHISLLNPANPVANYEHRVIMPDGGLRWQSWTDRAIFDAEGCIVEYASIGWDITERKSTEDALQLSERNLRRIAENMYDVISQIGPDGIIQYASPSHKWVLGMDPEDVVGKSVIENLHPDELTIAFEILSEAAATRKRPEPFTLRYQHADGNYLWMECVSNLLFDQEGEFMGAVLSSRDVTERRQIEESLRRSEELYRLLAENASDVIWIRDLSLRMTYVSPAVQKLRGVTVEEALSQSLEQILAPDSINQAIQFFAEIMAALQATPPELIKEEHRILELEMIRKDGSTVWTESQISFLLNDEGKPIGILGVTRDITERRRTAEALRRLNAELEQRVTERTADLMAEINERQRIESALRESEERYMLAVRGANDGLWDWNLTTDEIYFSPRWKTMLGYKQHEIRNEREEWFKRIHGKDLPWVETAIANHIKGDTDHFECEYRMLDVNNRYRWILIRGIVIRDAQGNAYRMAGSQTDITKRKLAEERLVHDALHDALTGLPNRTLFADRLSQRLEHSKRNKEDLFAVLFIDLDRFKVINDSLGHGEGDKLLITTALRLKSCLRPEDTVSRLGGDEFAILLNSVNDVNDTIRVAERIQTRLRGTADLGSMHRSSTASIGITLFNPNYTDPNELLRDADTAMYRAKAQGGAQYQIFDVDMYKKALALMQTENHLRQALRKKQFQVYYQPILSLSGGRVAGVEALVRWNHPERGIINPSEFIGIAEETGLVISIGEFILRNACKQMKAWHDEDHPELWVSVNISGRQFQDKRLVDVIKEVLESTGLPGRSLRVEVTETVAMKDIDYSVKVLKELNKLGIEISLDDFGNGYSSLGHLKRFPLKVLKIDRSFIQDLGVNKNSDAITSAIISMGHTLNLEIVAEGVETENQLEFLKGRDCDEVQGFLFSKPVPADEIPRFLCQADFIPSVESNVREPM